MRISTQLRIIGTGTLIALVVLAPVLIWSFMEFRSAKSGYLLATAIKVNFIEGTSIRSQYFLHREDRVRAQWEKKFDAIKLLLLQAEVQFHHEEDRQALIQLRRNIDDSAAIFLRIAQNTETFRASAGDREVYEELDKRLASQLLLKAAAINDSLLQLEDASVKRIEQAYKTLTIIIGLFAVTLAFATILTALHLGKLIQRRLVPLHQGAEIIANGDLAHRIRVDGYDEFAELALSVNSMTERLEHFTRQLEAEIGAHRQSKIALLDSEERLEMALSGADMGTWDWHIPSGTLIANPRWHEIQGYTPEELPAQIETWEARVFPDDRP
ncbi:MAG: HAMP domain-containing protein, partial [Proteobacteria bacterium]|nr:HAMP domain-containing protein [Pseudomonadota bacterium]